MKEAIFAGGCFWGVEYYMRRAEGVLSVESGFTAGTVENPTYQQVKTGTTGHAEAVKIVYDPTKTDYETLLKLFMEIHDPTQLNRQGIDKGTQYRSEVYYADENEKQTAEKIITILKGLGYDVQTKIVPRSPFYSAEGYHQRYYDNIGEEPTCHKYQKRFL
ncbi:MAG: peptide-methionine (S)-S-oxide reductase MsrA [Rikenellaceae bacterium]